MSDIIHLRTRRVTDTPRPREFSVADLVGGAIEFPRTGAPAVAVSDYLRIGAPHETTPPQDWDNQEIADLCRAQRLLQMAGISVETDRGLSDEGEPWFIFSDSNDEVFAHFCRIDGRYGLDSPAQGGLITANYLEELVTEFARRTQPVSRPESTSRGQIVQLVGHRNNKVMMHPGAALAALIWSVYMLSDDLLLPGPARAFAGVTEESGEETVSGADAGLIAATSDLALQDVAPDPSQSLEALHSSASPQDFREAPNQNNGSSATGTVAKAVISALAALAISYGIDLWSAPAETEIVPKDSHQAQTAAGLLDIALAEARQPASDQVVERSAEVKLSVAADIAANADPEEEHSIALDELADLTLLSFDVSLLAVDAAAIPSGADAQSGVDTQSALGVATLRDLPLGETEAQADGLVASEPLPVFSLIEQKQQVLAAIGDLTWLDLESYIELSAEVPIFAGVVQEDSAAIELEFELYNQLAREFIDFLYTKNDEAKSVSLVGEFVLFDMEAVEGRMGPLYAKSWSFNDGDISTVTGLKSDFEAFDLVA
ncbi:hypothetical protein [Candidatus Halocynthiibacter alkanivorans]|uniref:hypothetical protein n=1 Tax=Candidatus Halocynthiibacter alkanivorans TaxID=2267619 RepID=UPI000DF3689B|nr:hypothetical protein [Candidatus Halocynthiibacter alkanivorans]